MNFLKLFLFLTINNNTMWMEIQRQTNSDAITVDGQQPVLDNSIERYQSYPIPFYTIINN